MSFINRTYHCIKINSDQATRVLDCLDSTRPFADKVGLQEIIEQLEKIKTLEAEGEDKL
jgi:hypothetical protein